MSGVIATREGALLHLSFDRADKKNALTMAMYEALATALTDVEADEGVGVVVFSGQGGDFCAGNDLKDFLAQGDWTADAPVLRFLAALAGSSKVLVAAARGAAVGIGTTMLLHCDLVVSGADSRFALPFVDLGLVPEAGSSLLLPRLIGHQRAAELLLLGRPFSAEEALAWGLVNRVVPAEQVVETALDLARAVAAKPAQAIRETRRLLALGRGDVTAQMAAEIETFTRLLQSPALRQAVEAFLTRKQRS